MATKSGKKTRGGKLRVAVLSGPNLNLLGSREPDIYGTDSLADVEELVDEVAERLGVEASFFQSNHEGALIDHLHGLRDRCDGIIINGGGLSHTSVALRDALVGVRIPFVEVHLSNIYGREAFRRTSLLADVALGVVCGFGGASYVLGLEGLVARLAERAG